MKKYCCHTCYPSLLAESAELDSSHLSKDKAGKDRTKMHGHVKNTLSVEVSADGETQQLKLAA